MFLDTTQKKRILLGGVLLVGLSACATRNLSDWTRVQSVPPETRTEVQLYRDEATAENWKIKGHFHAATENSITLQLKNRPRHTFQKPDVHRVLARRPFSKRRLLWGTLTLTAGALVLDRALGHEFRKASILSGLLSAVAIHAAGEWRLREVYRAPPNQRDWYPQGTGSPTTETGQQKSSK